MINIVCVGKIKEKFYQDACQEYLKRLSKYTKINIIEVEDKGDLASNCMEKERDLILKNIPDKSYIITMEIDGIQYSSTELSKKIDEVLISNSNITFIIGGSFGLHNDIKAKSNLKLSFSKLTFPHQLFRVILLEQIYRSFKIINNESYHK